MKPSETLSYYRQHLRTFKKVEGETMAGFARLHEAAMADGALDKKTKELIALSIAVAQRCDDCIASHVRAALFTGATREEVMDAVSVAVLMGGGPALMYAAHAVEALEAFEKPAA